MLVRSLLVSALLTWLATPAHAAWNTSSAGIPVVGYAATQYAPAAASDGAGGAFVFWSDLVGGNYDVYGQHVLADGTLGWGSTGVSVCTATGTQDMLSAAPDGTGGVLLAWRDSRTSGTTSTDIYAQRVNAAGVPQWAANGLLVCNAAGQQLRPTVVADGTGGAIVVWNDGRAASFDVYARRVNAAGVAQWAANGTVVCNDAAAQLEPVAVADGVGGVIVGWLDQRNSGTSGTDLYTARLSSSGTNLWTANGAPLSTQPLEQSDLSISADGVGGAWFAWRDGSNGTDGNIAANRVLASGTRVFGGVGVLPCGEGSEQGRPVLLADTDGGAYVVWRDLRNATTGADLYAQHVLVDGGMSWTANGLAILPAPSAQTPEKIVADGAGGFIVVSNDDRMLSSISGASAQRVVPSGGVPWGSQGLFVSSGYVGTGVQAVPEPNGGALVFTEAFSNPGIYRILAHRVDHFGYLGDPAPVLTHVNDVRGDQGGQVVARWTRSYLDDDPYFVVADYRVFRSVPGALAQQWLARGEARLDDGGVPIPGTRVVSLNADATSDLAWEFVVDVPASAGTAEYSAVVPTTGDSTGASLPWTRVRVQARNGSGTRFWYSSADSAYSVDDLAPATPAPFTGAYNGGTTLLTWGANLEPDLAGYRLHRGASPAFVPDAGNLVAALAQPGFLDAAGQPYVYKLCAVDVHGNASGFATVVPAGALDAPDAAPRALALALASGNPVRGGATLRCALPAAARFELALYDASGRRVRVLDAGERPAGEHAVRWDGRDEGGAAVAPGIYLARLAAGGDARTMRLCVIR